MFYLNFCFTNQEWAKLSSQCFCRWKLLSKAILCFTSTPRTTFASTGSSKWLKAAYQRIFCRQTKSEMSFSTKFEFAISSIWRCLTMFCPICAMIRFLQDFLFSFVYNEVFTFKYWMLLVLKGVLNFSFNFCFLDT
jgi:hypothetical protein